MFFAKNASNVFWWVKFGPKPLSGPQNMISDHSSCLERLCSTFWKIEFLTSKTIFRIELAQQAENSVLEGVYKNQNFLQFDFSSRTKLEEWSMGPYLEFCRADFWFKASFNHFWKIRFFVNFLAQMAKKHWKCA